MSERGPARVQDMKNKLRLVVARRELDWGGSAQQALRKRVVHLPMLQIDVQHSAEDSPDTALLRDARQSLRHMLGKASAQSQTSDPEKHGASNCSQQVCSQQVFTQDRMKVHALNSADPPRKDGTESGCGNPDDREETETVSSFDADRVDSALFDYVFDRLSHLSDDSSQADAESDVEYTSCAPSSSLHNEDSVEATAIHADASRLPSSVPGPYGAWLERLADPEPGGDVQQRHLGKTCDGCGNIKSSAASQQRLGLQQKEGKVVSSSYAHKVREVWNGTPGVESGQPLRRSALGTAAKGIAADRKKNGKVDESSRASFSYKLSIASPVEFFSILNDRPIIGVAAQETFSKRVGDTYIPASYIKYLEQAGARVVPIRAGEQEDYYNNLFSKINGALFPGGSVSVTESQYARTGRILYNLTLKAAAVGDIFPLWGTCLGFELLNTITAGQNLLAAVDAENITLPLDLVDDDVLSYLTKESVTQNEHQYGMLPEVFNKNKELSSFYRILSTNQGKTKTTFISTFEAYKYPIYGTQWHPEKNAFNWDPRYVINHDAHAVRVAQYFANFFVNEARKSTHRFPSLQEEADALIDNYNPIYSADGTFMENYFFNFSSPPISTT
ncbi:LOW QUALITY PROTEIN: uncharacterized protein LOC112561388 [Pomacea canaliculata]|uniref:LOW QUALITY PROTEIN: uncharacterized protein LOC112561388 n=1 Tax=Pomacea canaliculata TaxID=400727 RepID=UPI000D72B78B|nr:LOW QUALITY PROTEIN: uncharacterized protein LOC112561388 [Pomacea canaliculata]